MKLSILVVDDEEPVRDLLGWMLEEAGHTVHAEPGGPEALAFLRARKPVDVVLSDVNMPGMDGVVLSRRIEAEFPHLPVLLISGRPSPAGVPAFLPKPFSSDTLAQAIMNVIAAPPSQPPQAFAITTASR